MCKLPFFKIKKKIKKKKQKKNILVIPRKFAPAHKKILSSWYHILHRNDKYLKPLKNLQWHFNLIIKPHPASNILELKKC